MSLLLPHLILLRHGRNPSVHLFRHGFVGLQDGTELLSEFPAALKHLISLCAASPMIASQLARYPLLLDELLDPNTLYQPTAMDAYRDELRQYLLRVPEDDEEQQLEALRQFKQAQLLRIAARAANTGAVHHGRHPSPLVGRGYLDRAIHPAIMDNALAGWQSSAMQHTEKSNV